MDGQESVRCTHGRGGTEEPGARKCHIGLVWNIYTKPWCTPPKTMGFMGFLQIFPPFWDGHHGHLCTAASHLPQLRASSTGHVAADPELASLGSAPWSDDLVRLKLSERDEAR